MSFSFVTAARIAMTRKGFDAWLDAPIPPAAVIGDRVDVFGDEFDWSIGETARTARAILAGRVADQTMLTLVRYQDGALEVYLWGPRAMEPLVPEALLMLAGAGAFKDDDTEDPVLIWGDAAGLLPDPDAADDAVMATLLVGPGGARFAGGRPARDMVAWLRPVEAAFTDLAEAIDAGTEGVTLDPRYVDPAVAQSGMLDG